MSALTNVKRRPFGMAGIPLIAILWGMAALVISGCGVVGGEEVVGREEAGTGVVEGTVRAPDGTAMEGVVVSVRAPNGTLTTSVYTGPQGQFSFEPLNAGQYSMWAQAKGFDLARDQFTLADGARVERSVTLTPLTDPRRIAHQLDGPEWFAALPEATAQDRRMKHLLRNNCTACHSHDFTMSARLDADGYREMIDMMARAMGPAGYGFVRPTTAPGGGNAVWQAYKDELAEYLGRVTKDLQPQPFPRPQGAATRLVVSEYAVPRQGRPVQLDAGTFWIDGTISRGEGGGQRDIWIDSRGNIWTADDKSVGRTIGRLDPRTGQWTDFAMLDENGAARGTHGIWGDPNTDSIFAGGQPDGTILMFDARAEQFVHFPLPEGMPRLGGDIDVDSQGNAWAPAGEGVGRLNPRTAEYTYFPIPYGSDVREMDKGQYGIAVDAYDNVWVTRPGAERVGYVNPGTGEAGEVVFGQLPFQGLTSMDREIARGMNIGPPNGKGPRRLGGDRKRDYGYRSGDYMWVALNKSDALARINVRTKEVKEYPLTPGSGAYDVQVDGEGYVWVPLMTSDRVARFDPRTEQFVEYLMPTRGTDMRHITLDNSASPPSAWVTYSRWGKIANLEVRPEGTTTRAAR